MKTSIKPFAVLCAVVLGAFGFFGSQNSFAADDWLQHDWHMLTLPQVHLQARFLAFSNDVSDAVPELLQFERSKKTYQVLTETNFQTLLHTIENRGKCEILGEPEAAAVSSWQTQLRATETSLIVCGKAIDPKALKFPGVETTNEIFSKYAGTSRDYQLETGPALDATPQVMTNGYAIQLNLVLNNIEISGYGNNLKKDIQLTECWKTNSQVVYVHGEKQNISITIPDCRFQTNQMTISGINLHDNQTVVLNGLDYEKRDLHDEKAAKKHLLIFVTATIVDPAGNRIHSDDEIPFARDSVPPQP